MQFVKPIDYYEALGVIGDRMPVVSAMLSSEWQDVPAPLQVDQGLGFGGIVLPGQALPQPFHPVVTCLARAGPPSEFAAENPRPR